MSMAVERCETVGRGPQARAQHAVTICGGYFVVFGGRNDSIYDDKMQNVAFNDLHLLNIESREWATLALFGEELPESRWGHTMVTAGGSLFIFGGQNSQHFCASALY
jgi:N-acetylneuraminic acid mutarotase